MRFLFGAIYSSITDAFLEVWFECKQRYALSAVSPNKDS
jgi:hypothetical protein